MPNEAEKDFVTRRVSALLSQLAKARGALRAPIDPASTAEFCRVLSIEHRPMIPEGVLSAVPGGFKIYLQGNFAGQPGTELRERFTLAHELAHTFFFDLEGDVPRPTRGSPKGQKLERLCHMGASQILVPAPLLRQEVEGAGGIWSAESVLETAGRFRVSVEVLIRRIHELGLAADAGFAAVLVDVVDGGRQVIRAACYDTLLLCNAIRPSWGMDFDSWVLPLLAPSGSPKDADWVRTTQTATIKAKKVFRSSRSFILDLRFDGRPARGA